MCFIFSKIKSPKYKKSQKNIISILTVAAAMATTVVGAAVYFGLSIYTKSKATVEVIN